jgi:cell division protein FtsN
VSIFQIDRLYPKFEVKIESVQDVVESLTVVVETWGYIEASEQTKDPVRRDGKLKRGLKRLAKGSKRRRSPSRRQASEQKAQKRKTAEDQPGKKGKEEEKERKTPGVVDALGPVTMLNQ